MDVAVVARLGCAASIASGAACVLVILFPAYGRCRSGNLAYEQGEIVGGFHLMSVTSYLLLLLCAATAACVCMRSVLNDEGIGFHSTSAYTMQYCRAIDALLANLMPDVFLLLVYFAGVDALSAEVNVSDTIETNLAKWEIVFVALYTVVSVCLAVLLYHSHTFLHFV